MNTTSKTESARVAAAGKKTNASIDARRVAAMPRGVGIGFPIYTERAQNAELWDVQGQRYIDFGSGIAVLNTGHRHPRIVKAIAEQLERFTHTAYQVVPYESTVALAERLNQLTPGKHAKKTAFFTTGVEAVENAIKIARSATRRPGVIALSGGFHGRTYMGMALTGKVAPYKAGFGPFPASIFHVPAPMALHGVTVEDSLKALQQLFKADIEPEQVAAIIVEPIQGEGGFYVMPPEFMRALREDLRPPRHPADRRRDPDRLCTHRQAVRDGALRCGARPDDDGQEPGRWHAAVGRLRPRRDHGRTGARRPGRHLRRQSAGDRRGPCRARRHQGREAE